MTSDNNVQKKCGFCGESIPANAGRCPYCGSIIEVTFNNSYSFTPLENDAVNQMNELKSDHTEQAQVEQNSEVNMNTSEPQNAASQQEDAGMIGEPISQDGSGQHRPMESQMQSNRKSYNSGGYVPDRRTGYDPITPLSNGLKVFLTVLFTIIPGIGQLAGIITAIVFMNAEGDSDRKSFGVALLVASLIMFVFACIGCFILVIAASSSNQFLY